MASVSSGMNAVPMPKPIAKQAKKTVGKYAVSGPTVANSRSPAAAIAMPVVRTGSGPNRVTSLVVMPWESDRDRERPRQEGRARLEGAVVANVLEVERAEEERRVHPRHEKAAHEARVDQAAHAQDAQRHDRVLMRASSARNAPMRTAASAPVPSTCADTQPWAVTPTMA